MGQSVDELLKELTLEEKCSLLSGETFNDSQSIPRLGIEKMLMTDGPHGLRKQSDKPDHLGMNVSVPATCFPPACALGSSWNREIVYKMGEALASECRAENVAVILGPGNNIKRSPLCGRNFEYYSEDPYLAGEAAAAFINGVQSRHVGTSIKHFAANNQEFNRMSASSEVDERTMREIYLPAFETAVKKSQPYTVMCSYNRINGTYASENPWLLTKVLRDEWGFEGYVMSDWGAVNDRVEGLKAGLELEMPASGGINDAEIVKAVQEGTLDEAVLDRAVERILNIVFEYVDNRKEQPLTLEKDHEFAQHVAEESIVLLKNEAVLPLEEQENVAFIGGFVKNPRYQGGGSSHVNSFKVTSAWDALEEKKNVTYAEGFSSEKDEYDEKLAAEAIETAKKADKAIIFAGLPESFESEGYDRKHMHLPECQNKLIEEIVKVQPNTIVVLHNGAAVEMPWLKSVKGLVEAYLGGQAVGQALVNILYGAVNPSGKLAETLPIKLEDNPSYLNFGDGVKVEYHEGIFVGYRYYEKKKMDVAFPFGHGLSYTTFKYSNLRTDKDTMTEGETIQVSVDVTNIGDRAGKEIVQLYVSDLTNAARRPEKELKGFEKVALNPGETKTVTFTVDKRSLAWYNTEIQDWYAASGTYEILIASSSRDIRLTKTIQWESAQILPLHLHLNTTLGELLSDERTKALGKELKGKLDSFFGGLDGEANEPTEGDEAVSDDMGDAIAFSMPIRNVVSFGLCDKEELIKRLEELNSR